MKPSLFVIVAAAACGVASVIAGSLDSSIVDLRHVQAGSKPVKDMTFHIDGGHPPPSTVLELWKRATVVFEGIVQAVHPVDTPVPGTTPPIEVVHTAYEFRVLEVFKPGPSADEQPTTLLVQRQGGIRDRGTHIERHLDTDFPLFEIGERYVIFGYTLPNQRYSVDPDGAFLVDGTQLVPRGKGEVARSVSNNAGLLRSTLRRRGGDQ